MFRNVKKMYIKVLHAGIQVSALIFAAVGLKAVFDFHNAKNITNMYTLHSWIGLTTVVLFGLQVGILLFISPWATMMVYDWLNHSTWLPS